MYLVVDLGEDPAAVSLAEAADCGRFHLAVRGGRDPVTVNRVLNATESGWMTEQGHAFVRTGALTRLAVGRVGPGWDTQFDRMVDYAASRGWLHPDGDAIQAHVEWE